MKSSVQVGAALAALVGINALATNADASVVDYAAVRVGQATNTEVSGISFSDDMTYGVTIYVCTPDLLRGQDLPLTWWNLFGLGSRGNR